MEKITSFRGYYDFLSNMYPSPIVLGGVTYTCAEAAFQAVKLEDKTKRAMFSGLNGVEAKKLGRQIELRKDWEKIKVDVMRWIIHEKFTQNKNLKLRLIRSTSRYEIEEGNTWGDTFWGICNGVGQNWLGKILMEERENRPDSTGYKQITKDELPNGVLNFAKRLYYEEREAGYTMKNVKFFVGEYYRIAYESWDPCDMVTIVVFIVSPDGEDSIQLGQP